MIRSPLSICAVAVFSMTGSVHALSLREAATLAVNHDPRMGEATAEVEASEASRRVAQANDHFTLGFAADVGREDLRTKARFPQSGIRTPNSAALSASQPLYNSGRTAALDEAARLQVEASLERRRDIGGKLVLAAVTAYLDAKRDRETLRLSQVTRGTLTQAREDVAKRLNAGEATRTDVSQADARTAEAEANVIRAEAQLRTTEIGLARLLGRVPDDLNADWPSKLPTATTREEAVLQSQTAPAVLSAHGQQKAAYAQIKAVASESKPTLSIDGHAGTQDNTEFGYDRLSTWAVQLKLNVPLYTGGRVPAKVAEARAKAAASQYAADDEQAMFAQTAASEWETLRAADRVIVAVQSQVNAAELSLDGVRKEMNVGSRTTLDLLDAERDLLVAQVNLVSAQRDRGVTAFRLLAACGTLELYNVPN